MDEGLTRTIPEPTRKCGDCSLCCKTFENFELKKPRDTWCCHAGKKTGCKIYEKRPTECSAFACLWLIDTKGIFAEQQRPDKTGIVIDWYPPDMVECILDPVARVKEANYFRVTQQYPGAWRKPAATQALKQVFDSIPNVLFVVIGHEQPHAHHLVLGSDFEYIETVPVVHDLGVFFARPEFIGHVTKFLDEQRDNPKHAAFRKTAEEIQADMRVGERSLCAVLTRRGFITAPAASLPKLERYAAFLREQYPDRTFQVVEADVPDWMLKNGAIQTIPMDLPPKRS